MISTEYHGEPDYSHEEVPAVGVLMVNLGTPDEPTAPALKRYLREFLWDPRVIEGNRIVWWLVLNLIVLRRRPPESAAEYREVWTDEGSPLLVISHDQRKMLQRRLRERVGNPLYVEIGMRYGSPSIAHGLRKLKEKGCRKILVLPLYPQYSATTTATAYDAVFDELQEWRWMPELRTVTSYHDHPGYIDALANSIREAWEDRDRPDKLLFSYHGIPLEYFRKGDPYHCHCHKTSRLVAEELGLDDDEYQVCFQSQFGDDPWLQPYTSDQVKQWGAQGVESVDAICPGFSADCLETLEEIGEENREYFLEAGGEEFHYIECLNDRADHMDALTDLAMNHLAGWVEGPEEWDLEEVREERANAAVRADELEEEYPEIYREQMEQ